MGWCPVKNFEDLSCTVGPRAGGQSISKAVSILSISFIALGTVRHEMGITTVGHHPCVSTFCLPDVTAHDQIPLAFSLRICIL